MDNLTKIREHWDRRIERVSSDYLAEIYGWSSGRRSDRKRTLPYTADPKSLERVRRVGREISTKPTGISATSKLISFAVGRGHTYTITARQPATTNRRLAQQQERRSAQLQLSLDVALEEMDWLSHQIETYERVVRDGECFRRIWVLPEGIDLTYLEPEDIDQPQSISQLDLATVPDAVREIFPAPSKPPGELGIVSDPDDVRRVLGYWMKREDEQFEFLNAQSVQHIKDGVDRNDPRGVPRFYWAFCHVVGIDEIDGAMRDLFLVQAKHAAIYQYESSSLISDIKRLAHRQQHEEEVHNDGRPGNPGVMHAKGFTVEMPGMNVAAKDAVEIIQQEQRLVGGCSDIPEHLISEDANTGNRSSLVAAEGPFDRRIQREQLMMWSFDRPLLWMIALRGTGITNPEQVLEITRTYKITPHFPAAQARDRAKEIESEIALVEAGIKSRRQARETLRIDSDSAEQDLQSDPPPDPAANNTGTGRAQQGG